MFRKCTPPSAEHECFTTRADIPTQRTRTRFFFFTKNPMLLLTIFILIIYSKMYERILSLCYMKYVLWYFCSGLSIFMCVSQTTKTPMCYLHICSYIYVKFMGIILGLLCLHPIFKNASAETSLTTPSRDQIIKKKWSEKITHSEKEKQIYFSIWVGYVCNCTIVRECRKELYENTSSKN